MSRPPAAPPSPRALASALGLAWLVAGVASGVRLHLSGGVFGDAVPLGPSVGTRLLEGLPWVGAAVVAWWAAGRWPVTKRDVLRPVTVHAWLGLAVVTAMQGVLAALRAGFVPPGLRPFDPWSALPGELTGRAPPALLVYGTLVAAALVWRRSPPDGQEVPGAGRGDDESS